LTLQRRDTGRDDVLGEASAVDIKVGIKQVSREIVIDSTDTAESVEKAFATAMAEDGLLTLNDQRGRKVLIPATAIGYLDIGEENARHVGFSV
jgi:uncharacterized protein DUF3107